MSTGQAMLVVVGVMIVSYGLTVLFSRLIDRCVYWEVTLVDAVWQSLIVDAVILVIVGIVGLW